MLATRSQYMVRYSVGTVQYSNCHQMLYIHCPLSYRGPSHQPFREAGGDTSSRRSCPHPGPGALRGEVMAMQGKEPPPIELSSKRRPQTFRSGPLGRRRSRVACGWYSHTRQAPPKQHRTNTYSVRPGPPRLFARLTARAIKMSLEELESLAGGWPGLGSIGGRG